MVVDEEQLSDLDAGGVLAEVEAARAAVVRGEFAELALAVHWVDLHAPDEEALARRDRARPGRERFVPSGAEGTPLVAEFALAELGAVAGRTPVGGRLFVADAVNVRFRHPLLWQALARGEGRVWQAREVSRMCLRAGLTLGQVAWVDEATSPYLATLPWSRFRGLVEAKIIEVDPQAAAERARAAAMARFVRTGAVTEHGIKSIYARASAGDAVCFTAMVDRIAHILAEHGDTDPVPVLRSKALGVLATPARALKMLLDAAPGLDRDPHPDDPADPADPAEAHGGEDDPFTSPGARLIAAALDRVDPRRLLPDAVLYVHLSQDCLTSVTPGVGRVEGVGAVTVDQVADLLGHRNVRVLPVLDVAGQAPVEGYEVPDRMREALHLRNPACAFPWATHTGRRKDADHVTRYRHADGPPSQTHLGNLAWLTRLPHRLKTHGRWRLRQPTPGVYLWRSPHGYWWRADPGGTRALGRETHPGRPPAQTWDSPVELDFSDLLSDHAA